MQRNEEEIYHLNHRPNLDTGRKRFNVTLKVQRTETDMNDTVLNFCLMPGKPFPSRNPLYVKKTAKNVGLKTS